MPSAALESMVFGLARLATRALQSTARIEYHFDQREGFACLAFRLEARNEPASSESASLDRVARLELDVDVAEWSGQLATRETASGQEVGIALPVFRSAQPSTVTKRSEESERG